LLIQWRPDTNDLYCGINIIPEDHISGDVLSYPLLFPYGTDDWTLQQLLHTVNVMERQYGQVVEFQRLEVQDRGAPHRITPKDFYNYRIVPRHGSPTHVFSFSFRSLFQEFLVVCYKKNVERNLICFKVNQPCLRARNYGMLQDQLFTDNFNEGVKVSGGPRLFFFQIC
jgi:hypothetical protein